MQQMHNYIALKECQNLHYNVPTFFDLTTIISSSLMMVVKPKHVAVI